MKYTYEQPDYLDVNGARHLVQELKRYIQDIMNGKIDISQYATKDELSSAVSSIDLSGYALKGEIPSLDGYAKTTDIPSVEGLATKTYVDENIAKVATSGDIDLSNYVTKDTVYTKAQTDALIPSVPSKVSELENDSNYLSSIPEEYVTDTELNAKGYLTSHQDLSSYALKTEIPTVPSLDGYATTEYVNNAIANVPTTDLSNYYTKAETYSKTEVDTLVANSGGSSSGGSSGGITYAFDTEIATGDIWVDGKPIYMKVIDFTNVKPSSSSGFNLYMVRYDGWLINEVIDSRLAFRNGISNYALSQISAKISGTNVSSVVNDINSKIVTRNINYTIISADTYTTIQVFTGAVYDNASKKIYLTVKYTKP